MSHVRAIAACSSCTEFRRDHIVFVGGHGYYFALRPLPTPTSNLLRRKWLLLVWQVLLSEGFFLAMLGMMWVRKNIRLWLRIERRSPVLQRDC